jgi:hypothetical protein
MPDEDDSFQKDPPQLYSFKMEEQQLIEQLICVLRVLLKRADLTAKDVYCTSMMLRALERMPLVTKGIGITLSCINHVGDGSWGVQSLTIDEEYIQFTTGESIYTPGPIGGEFQSVDELEVGIGWRTGPADLWDLVEWVADLYNRAEEPTIEVCFDDFAESQIDWYDDTDGSALWETLDSDYA